MRGPGRHKDSEPESEDEPHEEEGKGASRQLAAGDYKGDIFHLSIGHNPGLMSRSK